MNEPSVLDILKDKIQFWKKKSVTQQLPVASNDIEVVGEKIDPAPTSGQPEIKREKEATVRMGPWKTFGALILALIAQALLEPPNPSIKGAIGLYALAGFLAVAAILTREWELPQNPPSTDQTFNTGFRRVPFLISILLLMLSFFAFGGNLFTALNLTLWIAGMAFLFYALWVKGEGEPWWKESEPAEWQTPFYDQGHTLDGSGVCFHSSRYLLPVLPPEPGSRGDVQRPGREAPGCR